MMRNVEVVALDLYCGGGGAAWGYHLAGFDDIVGVDIAPQKNYPFRFIQADALEYLAAYGHLYDFIHASPPCQGYSIMRNLPWLKEKDYPMLIEPTRVLLQQVGKPWVIENVMGAKLDAGWLCGLMFDRPFYRHRYFQSSFLWFAPEHPRHQFVAQHADPKRSQSKDFLLPDHPVFKKLSASPRWGCGHSAGIGLVREAMEIDWMTRDELTQAVPPCYTRYVGEQWLNFYT